MLLIDDNADFCGLLADYLSDYGFAVTPAHSGKEGLALLHGARDEEMECDLVILDFFLPDINGSEVLRLLRMDCRLPVVMLSAHNEETDRILALEMGADDYVPKNFSSRELLARIRAVLRRHSVPAEPAAKKNAVTTAHGLRLDLRTQEATLNGAPLQLTAMEFNLLSILASDPGHVFSRDEIISKTGGTYYGKFDRSIDVHIASLRKKLGDDSKNPVYLKTLRGAGYRFVG